MDIEQEIIYELSILQYLKQILRMEVEGGRKNKHPCPLHPSKNNTLEINKDLNYFYCSSCKSEGDVIDLHTLIMGKTIKNYTRDQSIDYLRTFINI